jgi:hypothetical protein
MNLICNLDDSFASGQRGFSVAAACECGQRTGQDHYNSSGFCVVGGCAVVECSDRLHLKVAELVLRPLARFATEPELDELTVRPPGRGCWVLVTVSRVGEAFAWSAREIDRSGEPLSEGRRWQNSETAATPEAAYWRAIDAIATARRMPAIR